MEDRSDPSPHPLKGKGKVCSALQRFELKRVCSRATVATLVTVVTMTLADERRRAGVSGRHAAGGAAALEP